MARGDTTAFGGLQNYTNDVWLKRGCLHKYTHVPHIPCTKFNVSHLYTHTFCNTTNVCDAIYCYIHLFVLNAPSTFPTATILRVAAGLRFHPGSPDLKRIQVFLMLRCSSSRANLTLVS